jgi:hypothetical protein
MTPRGPQSGQASLLSLGLLAVLLAGTLVLFGFGQALGTRGKHQRAADLAAVSGAQVMRRHYSRLFEPAVLADGVPNPRHLSAAAYLAPARAAARRGARRNGVAGGQISVAFPGDGFAPTRITVGGSRKRRRPSRRRRWLQGPPRVQAGQTHASFVFRAVEPHSPLRGPSTREGAAADLCSRCSTEGS